MPFLSKIEYDIFPFGGGGGGGGGPPFVSFAALGCIYCCNLFAVLAHSNVLRAPVRANPIWWRVRAGKWHATVLHEMVISMINVLTTGWREWAAGKAIQSLNQLRLKVDGRISPEMNMCSAGFCEMPAWRI